MIPCKTKPFLCQKDWGGDRLHTLFAKEPRGDHTGESWEVSAHPDGECMAWGMPLSRAVERFGRDLLGDIAPPFPLLIKLLDAREHLSVQVHPDDALADELEGDPYGKTEAWVVLHAPEDMRLILGCARGPRELASAIERGELEEALAHLPVKPGDALYIPAGTVHALTAGALVYEVQQASDTTYRLYAWGREAQLHTDKALRAMAFHPQGAGLTVPAPIAPGVERLVDCFAFSLDRIVAERPLAIPADPARFACYTALGSGAMAFEGGEIRYDKGDTLLVPASAGPLTLCGGELLRALPKQG